MRITFVVGTIGNQHRGLPASGHGNFAVFVVGDKGKLGGKIGGVVDFGRGRGVLRLSWRDLFFYLFPSRLEQRSSRLFRHYYFGVGKGSFGG